MENKNFLFIVQNSFFPLHTVQLLPLQHMVQSHSCVQTRFPSVLFMSYLFICTILVIQVWTCCCFPLKLWHFMIGQVYTFAFEFQRVNFNIKAFTIFSLDINCNTYLQYQIMGNAQVESKRKDPFDKIPFFKKQQDEGGYKQLKDQLHKNCKCSYKTRIMGFVICSGIGWIVSLFASLIFIFKHNITLFAIFFSVGQILNITGSCFLAGPQKQAKDMIKRSRIIFSLLYVGSTIATIVLAFTLPERLSWLVLLTFIIQVVSYFLYTLSFIPFGIKILRKICVSLVE